MIPPYSPIRFSFPFPCAFSNIGGYLHFKLMFAKSVGSTVKGIGDRKVNKNDGW